MLYLPRPAELARMTTDEVRASFLITDLFQPGEVTLRAVDLDRVLLGGTVPTSSPLRLEATEALAAEYFTERREVGVLNTGGAGSVAVDGERFALAKLDMVYVGRGSREVVFESDDAANPARFYLVSYPAHAVYPTRRIAYEESQSAELGSIPEANRRRLNRYIHIEGAASAQLVMGVTKLKEGSVWNTMPAHTHQRRTEVYLYFDLPENGMVLHLLGEPGATRHVVVREGEVALSPSWSVHAGCGTGSYTFCWAMGGENQDFGDMQGVGMRELR